MKIHEHQAKEILAQYGVPVPKGIVAYSVDEAVKAAEEREVRGRKGIVEPDFTARVAQSFPNWGFVVLSKGNGGGVFANANLEVKRGKDVVAKLRVRNVEQNSAVADLIPGSVAEG